MRKLRVSKLLVPLIIICLIQTINSYALTTEEILDTTEVSVRIVYTNEYRRELAKEGIFLGGSETSMKIPASYFEDYEENVVYRINNSNGDVSARWKNVGIVKLRDVLPDASKEKIIEAIAVSDDSREGVITLARSYMLGLATCSIIILIFESCSIFREQKKCIKSKGDQES